jgi:hypothetical protein
VASTLSIMSLAWVIFHGGLVCTSVLSTLVTVWCILSQVALDCGFLLVEHTSLMLKISNSHWKFCLMNSPPLSCKHCTGQADRACGSSAHGQTDSQLNILLLLCSYICSTYYVRYVEYKYRSARKSDLMDTSNPPQADVDMNTATINVDWTT